MNGFHVTEVVVHLPDNRTLSQNSFSVLRRMLSLETNLLKSRLETSYREVPLSDHIHHQVQNYHLNIYAKEKFRVIPTFDIFTRMGFKGEEISDSDTVNLMKTDFAKTIHSTPEIILRPLDPDDLKVVVHLATELGLSITVRGSRVSHSAGGQAQCQHNGILLDISHFSSITFKNDFCLEVGAGAMWNDVIKTALSQGLMPPVVNDYQYLSVGGTISMGGIGFMSHQFGIQAGHVNNVNLVSGLGDMLHCSKEIRRDLFDTVRGGLGNFGIITSVTLPLIRAPTEIIIFKGFYLQEAGLKYFAEDMKNIIDSNTVDMVHAFIKPSNCVVDIIGNEAMKGASANFKDTIKDQVRKENVVFFIEFGCYQWDDEQSNNINHADNLQSLLSKTRVIDGNFFQERTDFYTYITRDPPVVETNKKHGSIPHPSFATIVPYKNAMSILEKHLGSESRGNDETNEILVMPLQRNDVVSKGHETPMFPTPKSDDPLFLFLLFLGSVTDLASDEMQNIRSHHRMLHEHSTLIGGKRYSYDTITSDIKGEAWKKHYGESVWELIVQSKQKHDPYFLFKSMGVQMF